MAWDFTADSDNQKALAGELKEASKAYLTKIQELYNEIHSMGENQWWVGDDYNLYQMTCDGYKSALDDVGEGINMYGLQMEKISAATEELSTKLTNIINDMAHAGELATANGAGPTVSPGTYTGNGDSGSYGNTGGGTGGTTTGDTGNPTDGTPTGNPTGNPTGGNVASPDLSTGGTQNQTVTVQSGQKVNLNGEEVYFLMKDRSGNTYYTKSTDPNAQVFVSQNGGALSPYTSYSNNNIVSREDFVNDRKQNLDYYWNTTYNNGTSPYQSVSNEVDSSFTAKVSNPNQGNVVYDTNYLNQQATTLNQLDMGQIGLGRENTPEVIYLAPNQSIKYDKPWDTYDNEIKGGANGTYLIYDSNTDAYYKIADDGSYNTRSDGTFGLWISREQLLDERTTINR